MQGVTGYTIRQTVDGTETEIDVSGRTTATYIVGSLTAGKSYTFTIAVVAGSTESAQSSPTSAVTPTAAVTAPTGAPQGVNAAAGAHQVVLSWNAVSNAAEYKVYQNGSALSPNVSGLTHTVTGLTAGPGVFIQGKCSERCG